MAVVSEAEKVPERIGFVEEPEAPPVFAESEWVVCWQAARPQVLWCRKHWTTVFFPKNNPKSAM